jgi:GNAT superfamily N-acetyltransferase
LPPTPLVEFRVFLTENRSFVALLGDVPAGFAICGEAGGRFWLKELAVDPVHGRRGIGTALIDAAIGQARRRGHRAIFLSTFRDVPFNQPFYAKRGFVAVDTETAAEELRAQFLREVPAGIDPATRVLMVRDL